jgi:hypothetical protein
MIPMAAAEEEEEEEGEEGVEEREGGVWHYCRR